jgi:putative transposase
MTAPRQVLPGTTYLVTRRCFQRQLLLRPAPITSGIFLYVLAVAAQRFGIHVHAFCVLSNHYHLVVTDPDAELPAFERYLDSLVARAVNASLGRCETFWAPASYSAVALQTPEDVLEKAAYVLANPVAAGLVAHGRDWPGLWSPLERIGDGVIEAKRPEVFFRKMGRMPERAELTLTAPPGFEAAEFRNRLTAELAAREEQAATAQSGKPRTFLGIRRVLAQNPLSRPVSNEPRRELNPRVASRDKWKRIEALERLVSFLSDYRAAWVARRNGKNALFPAGTYWLRVAHGVPCLAPG